jgi:hypothetical protein
MISNDTIEIQFYKDKIAYGEKKEPNKDAESLKACGPGRVSVHYRGSTGGLGYAHNKIMIVNPGKPLVKIVYSSGNMTSGTSTNHENWNFITTSGESYFAAAHKCVVESMISSGDTKDSFAASLNECRGNIKATPEMDIKNILPGEKGQLDVTFDPFGKKGHATKIVTVYIRGMEPKRITLEAEIEK